MSNSGDCARCRALGFRCSSCRDNLDGMVRCASCGQFKPGSDFRANPYMKRGLHSWCRDCESEYSSIRRRRQGPSPSSPSLDRIGYHLGAGNALEFSRSVCDHVVFYTAKKIREFELMHGAEAPPHLVAIHGVAKSLAAQHPAKQRRVGRGPFFADCTRCGTRFESPSTGRLYCDECRPLAAIEARRRQRSQPRVREQRNAARRRARMRAWMPAVDVACTGCGATFRRPTGSNLRYCDACRQTKSRDAKKRGQAKWGSKLVTAACELCGGTFQKANKSKRRYCSDACRDEARRATAVARLSAEEVLISAGQNA